jgi:hypothetical protein
MLASGGAMDKRSLEKVARRRHRRDKLTIDHLEGLSIEGQVRKKWDPKRRPANF